MRFFKPGRTHEEKAPPGKDIAASGNIAPHTPAVAAAPGNARKNA
ncbi:MAG TPA: hypothetical protein VF555_16690 [Variovorax sp.]